MVQDLIKKKLKAYKSSPENGVKGVNIIKACFRDSFE